MKARVIEANKREVKIPFAIVGTPEIDNLVEIVEAIFKAVKAQKA